MFSERLDFLMKLANTTSTEIAKDCNVDRTYITRLRDGSRDLPKKPKFLSKMSAHFARCLKDGYQKSVMCSTLKLGSWPQDEHIAAQFIEEWLFGINESRRIEPLLTTLSAPDKKTPPLPKTPGVRTKQKQYYFGKEGKQQAILQFFKLILKEKKPQTLYLFSDEGMEWLFGDPEFALKWRTDFIKVLKAGNRVKIVHNIGISADEMIEAIAKWLPIYMTGMIEPYYYPEFTQTIFKNTFFIAPETAAIIGSSVTVDAGSMFNELVTDKAAIDILTQEYTDFFKLCTPLMGIYTSNNRDELLNAFKNLIKEDGDITILSGMPTLLTMPQDVAKAMQKRAPESCIYEIWKAVTSFEKKRNPDIKITEIITPPNRKLRKPKLLCSELYGMSDLRYTWAEWTSHIDSCECFQEKHDNYRLIQDENALSNICIITKENSGLIMIKGDNPNIAFSFTEPRIIRAFWNYLQGM